MLITLPMQQAWYINTDHVTQVHVEAPGAPGVSGHKYHVNIVMSDGQRIKYGPSHDEARTAIKAAHDLVSDLNLMKQSRVLPKPGTDNPMTNTPNTKTPRAKTPIGVGPDIEAKVAKPLNDK